MHYLDFKKDADPPARSVPVDTERDFLRLALSSGPLLVRGKSLCAWAETFWTERGIAYTTCTSLTDELRGSCAGLMPEDATILIETHGDILRSLERPLLLPNVLEALFPIDTWHQPTGLQHAARWLLWLDAAKPPGYARALIQAQADSWHQTAEHSLKPLYAIITPDDAHTLLRRWLRLTAPYLAQPSVAFPIPVPHELRTQAAEQWKSKALLSEGTFFEDLSREPVPNEFLSLAADICFDYLSHNPHLLTESKLRKLRAYLADAKTEALRKLLPPAPLAPIPDEVAEIFTWFLNSYLPNREWAILTGSQTDILKTTELARTFAVRFLDAYPQLVMGQHPHISFQKAGHLRERKGTEVIVYAILDGLNVPDSLILTKHIASRTQRLTILQNDLCFSPVPTITEICKQALKRGYTPRMAAADRNQEPSHVITLPEKKDPDALLQNARPGDLFIWSIMEPDSTYHSKGYDRQTLKQVVAGRLESVADRIIKAILSIPDDKKARLIITTDHGRLLNSSDRYLAAPPGMKPHQRAAVGKAPVAFPATGIVVNDQDGVAFLNSDRFHVPEDSAVVLGEGSFLMDDGKSGTELFPHGGVFPEEVIIPWIELGKDAELPTVICTITGDGQESTQGVVHITIQNPSNMTLRALALTLTLGATRKLQLPIDRPLTSWSTMVLDSPLTPWPSEPEARKASALLNLLKPNGDNFLITAAVTLKVHGFQSRTDILDDLF